MLFISLFVLFFKKFGGDYIKANRTPMRLEIINHIINFLNRNISEDGNVKSHKSWPVDNQFVCNNTLLCMSIKNMNPICGEVVS